MSAPRLTVAMAVHNGMPFLAESVGSILRQSFEDFEFIIGDDGSTDGGHELLRRLAAQDSRIRLFRRERKSGLAASANWVIGEARSPLIAITHADDIAKPHRLRRQMEVFSANPDAVLVGTLCDGIDESGQIVRPADCWRLFDSSPFAPFGHASIMFRRDLFHLVGGYRTEAEYWEDLDLYFRLASKGRILVVPEVLTSIRHSNASTRQRDETERVENAVDLMYRAAELYRRRGDHQPLLDQPRDSPARLHPRTFIARGSTRLWSGHRPGALQRLLRRGRFTPLPAAAQALVWTIWGEISPRSLRSFVRAILRARNALAMRRLRGRGWVEWQPRRHDRRSGLRAVGHHRRSANATTSLD